MSFKVQATDGDRWEVLILGEPNYIHALLMAPEAMEPELNSGVWLIVTFPVWSAPVRHSVLAAIACAKDHGGIFQLGIRPFDSHDEINKWWPVGEVSSSRNVLLTVKNDGARREIHISSDPSESPVWLVLRDGHAVHAGAGPRSKEQLRELMQAALDRHSHYEP